MVPTPHAVRKGLFSCEFLAQLQELYLHGSLCLLSALASWLCQMHITISGCKIIFIVYVCPQMNNQTIAHSLQQTQYTVEQYLQDSDQLRSQLALLQQQQTAVLADKEHVMEENRLLNVQVGELQMTVQGLEATKEQLEADRYYAQTSLNELEKDHQQV